MCGMYQTSISFRKEDAVRLELVHIAKLDKNGTRFFYQKKKFQLPQYVPQSLSGYVMYGFEEIAQWHVDLLQLGSLVRSTIARERNYSIPAGAESSCDRLQ